MDDSGLSLDDFDFELPEHLISLRPAEPRGSARLVVGSPPDDISFHHVRDLPNFLRPDDLLVFNNTKVIPARLRGVRAGPNQSGQVELLLLQPLNAEATQWSAMARPLKKLTPGSKLQFGSIAAEVVGRIDEQTCQVSFQWSPNGWQADLDEFGLMPLPPYIERKDLPTDRIMKITSHFWPSIQVPWRRPRPRFILTKNSCLPLLIGRSVHAR